MITKAEPLRNKLLSSCGYNYETGFSEKDIKSAVEWLKQNISGETITIQNVRKKIDEAFEDVMK